MIGVELDAASTDLPLNVRKPTPEMLKHFELVRSTISGSQRTKHAREAIYADRIAKLTDAPDTIRVPLQALQIGELGIAAVPFETFAETGLELKARSEFQHTFTIELANGSFGYLPTPDQHRLGGYETWLGTNNVELNASTKIVNSLLEMLHSLRNGK